MGPGQARLSRIAVVAARNEADRIGSTIAALQAASPGIAVFVADDASDDETAARAREAGAEVVTRERPFGKGDNVTAACRVALPHSTPDDGFLLCDGDLGETAGRLVPLLEAVEANRCDLAIAAFSRRLGGGVGAAKGFARWAIRELSGLETAEPLSGQRAMRAITLDALLPFAPRYGMEAGMTVDAVRFGARVAEVELDLSHRATGRTLGGFLHRACQLRDIAAAYRMRRG